MICILFQNTKSNVQKEEEVFTTVFNPRRLRENLGCVLCCEVPECVMFSIHSAWRFVFFFFYLNLRSRQAARKSPSRRFTFNEAMGLNRFFSPTSQAHSTLCFEGRVSFLTNEINFYRQMALTFFFFQYRKKKQIVWTRSSTELAVSNDDIQPNKVPIWNHFRSFRSSLLFSLFPVM